MKYCWPGRTDTQNAMHWKYGLKCWNAKYRYCNLKPQCREESSFYTSAQYEYSLYFQKRKQDILINTQKTELNIRVRKHSYLKSWLHHLLSLDFYGTAQNEFWYFDTQLQCRIYELNVCRGICNSRRAYYAVTLPGYSNKMMMMMLVSFDIGHVYKHDDDDEW